MVHVTSFEPTFLTPWNARNVLCTTCDVASFNGQEQLCRLNLSRRKRSFIPYQNERDSVKEAEKPQTKKQTKKTCKVDPKIPMFHYPLALPSVHLILRLAKGARKAKEQRTREEGESFKTVVLKFCFLCMPKLRKLISEDRRQRSVRLTDRVLGHYESL